MFWTDALLIHQARFVVCNLDRAIGPRSQRQRTHGDRLVAALDKFLDFCANFVGVDFKRLEDMIAVRRSRRRPLLQGRAAAGGARLRTPSFRRNCIPTGRSRSGSARPRPRP